MARETEAAIMLNVSITDQIRYGNKLTQKPLSLQNMELKIIFTLLLFTFSVPSKNASAAVLADPFSSLSISDLYLVHTLHHIFTTNLVPSSSIIFFTKYIVFPPLQVSC